TKQRNNVDQAGNDLDYPIRSADNPVKQPSLQMNKNLINRRTHLSARKAIAADLIKSESRGGRLQKQDTAGEYTATPSSALQFSSADVMERQAPASPRWLQRSGTSFHSTFPCAI